MGKGSRVKNASDEINQLKKERREREAAAQRKKKKTNIITTVVIAVVAVALVGGMIFMNAAEKNGFFLRSKIMMKTENFKINAATFSYFFNYDYQTFVNENSSYLSNYGLDVETSLREQQMSDGKSWFDYMEGQTEKNLREMLVLAERAREEGIELEKADTDQIEALVNRLTDAAKEEKISVDEYVGTLYGEGISIDDIKKGLEVSVLGTKYYNLKITDKEYTDDEINKFYQENKNDYLTCDYKYYTFTPKTDETMSAEQTEAAKQAANANAQALSKAGSVSEFDSIVKKYLSDSEGKTQEEIDTAIKGTELADSKYDESFEVSKWAFGEDAKLGQTYIYKNGDSYAVYMLTRLPARDETKTASVRHILVKSDSYDSDEKAAAKAQEILDEYNKGDKTSEAFGVLAEKYTEDTGSANTGGLYENFKKGEMVESFDTWSFDPTRKPGDTAIVKSDYGYHVMYFESTGLPMWNISVVSGMKQNDYTALNKELTEKYPVTMNSKNLDLIPMIKFKADSTAAQS